MIENERAKSLSRRWHNALSYHRAREAIAAGIVRCYHVAGNRNPADILSKHWGHSSVWPALKPLLFWQGGTAELSRGDKVNEE